ncbi:ABC transporter substrate-binding protein [Nocardioides sp. Bht2]|uniref:ABC transporter substrate-binding protein n=1 Tax=Nocardioides sp. Bht2 TaxID=3392297 RepID=UPI0039B563A2
MRNRPARYSRLAVAALAGALVLTACADTGDDKSSSSDKTDNSAMYVAGLVGDQSAGTPKKGGTLEVIEYGEARSLDPTKTIPNGAVGGNALAAIYDVLMSYDPATGEYSPLMAKSLETKDSKTWTLTLRDGVNFTDGTPLNAQAVVASIGYYMQNQGFNTLLLHTNISKMTPQGDNTVVFTLNKPWATFPAMLAAGPGMILAPAAIAGGPEKFKPIGAGPFKFDTYKPAEELILSRNEKYFGEAPNLDKLRFTWVQADQAKLDSLKAGSADVISVRTAGVLENARKDGFAGAMSPAGISQVVWINNREGRGGSDERLRKAINLATNPEQYLDRTQGGAGQPTRGLYSEAFAYYKEIELPEQNIAEAKKLVAEAKADGADTSLSYITQSDQTSQTGAVTLEAQLEAVGFDIEVELLRDITEQTTRLYVKKDFDLAMGSMSLSEDPYMSFANNVVSTSPANPSGYANKEMDALVADLQTKMPVEAVDTLAEINALWQETVPGAVISAGGFFSPWGKNVHGVVPTGVNMLLFHKAWKS